MITANRQMDLVRKVGRHYKDVIVIGNYMSTTNLISFDKKVMTISGVEAVSKGNLTLINAWVIHGTLKKEDGKESQTTVIKLAGDKELVNVLHLNQIVGENWEKAPEKYPNSVFINKSFADFVEKSPENLIGEPLIKYFGGDYASSIIAGVVEDFYFNSLEEKTAPVVLERINDSQQEYYTMLVKLKTTQKNATVKSIKLLWEKTYPNEYFTYKNVYNVFIKRNSKIFEMSRLLQMYSLISILLICFGLFGISFYTVRQRIKEIGIRKINGAKTPQILWLLLKPIFVWMAIGFVIAVPLAWWLMEKWLQQFAYRVDVLALSCLVALVIVAAVSVLTVAWHTWRTARSNPVKSLKSD